ncbi:cytochrome P450 2W1 [Bombina bombina]|uniref:cytochrome P450 2W1 n=1 Tax=Bombina bombina TaxID=8345 RepID=UPI00235A63F2|nr:cytochrome P450 2W1 [Bombina bombina]
MSFLSMFLPDSLTICLIFSLLILIGSLYFFNGAKKSAFKMPPGPKPLPIIGNLHLLNFRRQDLSLIKLSETYGPIFTIHLGMKKAVVLTGLNTIKEALVDFADSFSDRAALPIFYEIQHGNGVFFSNGDMWKTSRRFTISSMRSLGMGKKLIEDRIVDELQFLIGKVQSFNGNQFKLKEFACAPTNITFSMIFGSRFEYKDPLYIRMLDLIDDIVVLLGSPYLQVFNIYPAFGFLMRTHKIILQKIDEICLILKKEIKEKRQTINNNCINTFVEMIVAKQEEERNNDCSLFHDDNLLATTLDLIMAGTETTSTTLMWGLLLMMKYPDIQKKVRTEIQNVLPSGRLPTFEDRNSMPFTQAVIHEVQRFANLLPHIPHATSADTHFKDYYIPKGTTVIPLLASVLYDKSHWETPFEFNPNHFLDAEGKFVKNEAFVPFSIGRRLCVGESLARMELYIFFTGLLQKFIFVPPPGTKECDLILTADPCFTLRPQPGQECCAQIQG